MLLMPRTNGLGSSPARLGAEGVQDAPELFGAAHEARAWREQGAHAIPVAVLPSRARDRVVERMHSGIERRHIAGTRTRSGQGAGRFMISCQVGVGTWR